MNKRADKTHVDTVASKVGIAGAFSRASWSVIVAPFENDFQILNLSGFISYAARPHPSSIRAKACSAISIDRSANDSLPQQMGARSDIGV